MTAEPVSFTVAATGGFQPQDALVAQGRADSRSIWGGGRRPLSGGQEPRDLRPVVGALTSVVGSADLGICHLEAPEGTGRDPDSDSPQHIVDAIASVGYDTCSTTAGRDSGTEASAGTQRTLRALDNAGIKHTGAARTARQANRPNLMEVKGVKVAQLAYRQRDSAAGAARILADARQARARGAEVVILSMDWENKYEHQPGTEQTSLARRLLSGPEIDLIIGPGSRVVQPFDKINGKWVAYGVGSQIGDVTADSPCVRRGVVAQFQFARDTGGRWRVKPSYVPTLVVAGPPMRLHMLSAQAGTDDGSSPARRAQYRETVRATAQLVAGLGQRVPMHREPALPPPPHRKKTADVARECAQLGEFKGRLMPQKPRC